MTREFNTGLDIDGNVILRGNDGDGYGRNLYWYVDAGHQPAISASNVGLYIHATSTTGQEVIIEGSSAVVLRHPTAGRVLVVDGATVTIIKPVVVKAADIIGTDAAGAEQGRIHWFGTGATQVKGGSQVELTVGSAQKLIATAGGVTVPSPMFLTGGDLQLNSGYQAIIQQDPTSPNHATRKSYVDAPFTSVKAGVVPASGGGAINFLRADATWAAPPAGSGGITQAEADTRYVNIGGDEMTGQLLITPATYVADPLRITSAPGDGNYISFYHGTNRRGYVGAWPADATTFRVWADTAPGAIDLSLSGTNIILRGGASETARATLDQFLVGKTAGGVNTTGIETKMSGQFAATVTTDIANFICNAIGAAAVTGHEFVSFRTDNGVRGNITRTSGGVAYNTTSDYRLKNELGPIESAVERCLRLQPKRLEWKADPGNEFDGFIAHEVAEIVPEAVTGEKDAVTPEPDPDDPDAIPAGEIVPQQLDHTRLVPLLVASVQELAEETARLRAELAALRAS